MSCRIPSRELAKQFSGSNAPTPSGDKVRNIVNNSLIRFSLLAS
jgi:hypothetical protein